MVLHSKCPWLHTPRVPDYKRPTSPGSFGASALGIDASESSCGGKDISPTPLPGSLFLKSRVKAQSSCPVYPLPTVLISQESAPHWASGQVCARPGCCVSPSRPDTSAPPSRLPRRRPCPSSHLWFPEGKTCTDLRAPRTQTAPGPRPGQTKSELENKGGAQGGG